MADAGVERAYAAAISRVVTPGDIVLDLGGAFAARAVRACRAGAARVYSVQLAGIADTARMVARDNGCAGCVEVIETIPAAAAWLDAVTVVIGEEPGGAPVHGASLTRWRRDGRSPWPAGAATIPRAETFSAAIVSARDLHARHFRSWESLGGRWDLSAAGHMAQNVWSVCRLDVDHLLTDPRPWGRIDYGGPAGRGALGAVLDWRIDRGGEAHGIAVWPTVDLADGVAILNAPGSPGTMGQTYFPWPAAVSLAPGDFVTVSLRVEPLSTGWESCLWNWTTAVTGSGHQGPGAREFVQSTFLGSLELLRIASRPVG